MHYARNSLEVKTSPRFRGEGEKEKIFTVGDVDCGFKYTIVIKSTNGKCLIQLYAKLTQLLCYSLSKKNEIIIGKNSAPKVEWKCNSRSFRKL